MAELVAPRTVEDPPFRILRLSHVEYNVRDLEVSRAFYVDLMGMVPTGEDDGQIWLRAMEERGHHSIVLKQGASASVGVIGFKVFDEADLDRGKKHFEASGITTEWIERPFMGRVLRVRDPWGVPLEFYAAMDRLPSLHQKYGLYRGVKPLRIDHANLFSPDVDGAVAFYESLGFRLTEHTEDASTRRKWAAWMHRKGTVHDVAFTNGFGPRMHHFALWVANPLHIVELLDIMSTTGYLASIERGPGRHGISNAFFLYVRDPDGHRVEIYSSDYQTIDPDHEPIKWDLGDPTRQTLWGAPAPRSWFEEGSPFEGVEVREPVNAGTPIVAP